jgi:N-acetylmuramoyl-L-alanine amidase
VLKSPDIPSMLVETAFISNPDEEKRLRNGSYQNQLADSLLSGILDYFQEYPPPGTRFARQSGRSPDATSDAKDYFVAPGSGGDAVTLLARGD